MLSPLGDDRAIQISHKVIPIRKLREAVSFLERETHLDPLRIDLRDLFAHRSYDELDFAEVKRQESVSAPSRSPPPARMMSERCLRFYFFGLAPRCGSSVGILCRTPYRAGRALFFSGLLHRADDTQMGMKPDPPTMRSAIAIMVLAGIIDLQAQTVLIRNQKVDLSPIIEWLDERKGDRPMPHWKVVEIDTLLGKGWGGGYRATVNVDGKRYKGEILIQNIPATLLEFISADDATLAAMADIETKVEWIRQRDSLARQANARLIRTFDGAYEQNMANMEANAEAMRVLNDQYEALRVKLRFTGEMKQSKFLAYFTGQKVGDFEVWDCGVGSKVLAIEGLK